MKRSLQSICGLLLLLTTFSVSATDRVSRRLDSSDGPLTPPVFALAQDAKGFIWIGTVNGLVRYDGSELRPWSKEVFTRDTGILAASPKGDVFAAEYGGPLYRVIPSGVELVPGTDTQSISGVVDICIDKQGRLWVKTNAQTVLVRDLENNWSTFDSLTLLPGERVTHVRAANDDGVFLLTDKAVWKQLANESPTKIIDVANAVDVVSNETGSVFVLSWPREGVVTEVTNGKATERLRLPARPIDLAMRGSVVWASYDRFLVSLREGTPPDVIGPEERLPSGGPLLVDHEGSLWLGTFISLIQYPEPETVIWTQRDGLLSNHTRWLGRTKDSVWVTYFGAIGRLQQQHDGWKIINEQGLGGRRPCIDSHGTVWASSPEHLYRRHEDGHFRIREGKIPGNLFMCAPGSDQSVWFATRHGLFRMYEDGRPDDFVELPAGNDGQTSGVLATYEDQHRTIWASTTDGRICHALVATLESNQKEAWSCQTFGPYVDVFGFLESPSGELWASTSRAGLQRFHNGLWERHPSSRLSSTSVIYTTQPSISGGTWIVGGGTTIRVVDDTAAPGEFTILENLSRWHGLQYSGGADIVEDTEGQLWIATAQGVVQMPNVARRAPMSQPRVALVDVAIDGQRATSDTLRLPNGSDIELHFAALSYRDRSLLRYQYRLHPDTPWVEMRGSSPLLRFVDLRSGSYQAEMRASLDGQHWSTEPARLTFTVLAPWFVRPWAIVAYVIIAVAGLYILHRMRVGVLLRLERQRAEIAMDLHDEMGSGLGSIGILSELAGVEDLDRSKQRQLNKEIAETADELGTALTEIVWTLRPGPTTLESLAYHLAERGGRLFPSDAPAFITEFPPEWPSVNLSLAVRRNLLLIASEALHNASRHANARSVVLGILPSDNRWKLWIADDGCGMQAEVARSNEGMGMSNVYRRAADIAAELSFDTGGRGTTVSIVFDPKAAGSRVNT